MSIITSFFPLSAYAGDTVSITGTGFTGATAVTFGGIAATSFIVIDDTTIQAVVDPASASGNVAVTTPAGTVTIAGFVYQGIRAIGVKIKMTQSPPYAAGNAPQGNDLVWVWDSATNTLRQAPISSLPFTDGGGGAAADMTTVPSPFFILTTTPNYAPNAGDGPFMDYDAPSNTTTIRDARLLNQSYYPVFTTQFGGGEFRLNELAYDIVDPDHDTLGKLMIMGFELAESEHITIIVPGEVASASNAQYQQLLADVALLKLIAAPFMPTALGVNGAAVWWTQPISQIPVGWQVRASMAGKVPLAQDPNSPTLNGVIGTPTGQESTEVTLLKANLPPISFTLGLDLKGGGDGINVLSQNNPGPRGSTPPIQIGGTSQPITVPTIPPSQFGVWIEFVGIP